MKILILLLTFILVVTCLFLCLLVLVQLPKKEAGLGQAFGSGATDALFGPGSGNMLTKLTKWAAAIFFALTLLVWLLHGQVARPKVTDPRANLTAAEKAALTPMPQKEATTSSTNATGTNLNLLQTNANLLLTNAAAATATTNGSQPK
jgi:preprotein translocase subunit SecG